MSLIIINNKTNITLRIHLHSFIRLYNAEIVNYGEFGWFMLLNATFNTIQVISWRSFLLVEGTGVSGDNN
jgi:hypothetical protein